MHNKHPHNAVYQKHRKRKKKGTEKERKKLCEIQPAFGCCMCCINIIHIQCTLQGPAFACQPALKSSLKYSFSNIFKHFFLISGEKSLKNVSNEEKGLKMAQKVISNSFWVGTAPQS